jgi:hypothetical protein
VTINDARAILRRLPLPLQVAIGRELDTRRPLEAHRLLTQEIGDGRQAKAVIAALIRWRVTGK